MQNKNAILYVDVGGTWTTFGLLKKSSKTKTNKLLLKKQIKKYKAAHAIVGMRGVWTSQEKKVWKKRLSGAAQKITMMSDIELVHARVFGSHPGIVLNAGTGSIALGRSAKGKMMRRGGVGPLLGDEGSAFWMGREFIKKYRNHEWKKNRALSVPEIAALAKGVIQKAKKGNRECQKIINRAQHDLKNLLKEIISGLKLKNPPIYLAGGLFKSPYFRKKFKQSFRLKSQFV